MRVHKHPLPYLIIGAVFAVAFLSAAYLDARRVWSVVSAGSRTQGMVIEVKPNRVSAYPVVRYQVAGETYTLEGDVERIPPGGYRPGQSVDVLFLPDRPQEAILDVPQWWTMWGTSILRGVMGIPWLIIAVAALWQLRQGSTSVIGTKVCEPR